MDDDFVKGTKVIREVNASLPRWNSARIDFNVAYRVNSAKDRVRSSNATFPGTLTYLHIRYVLNSLTARRRNV